MVKVRIVHLDGQEWIGRLRDVDPDDPEGSMGPENHDLPPDFTFQKALTAKGQRCVRGSTNRFVLDESTKDELLPVYRETEE